jgi:hypothetical protein
MPAPWTLPSTDASYSSASPTEPTVEPTATYALAYVTDASGSMARMDLELEQPTNMHKPGTRYSLYIPPKPVQAKSRNKAFMYQKSEQVGMLEGMLGKLVLGLLLLVMDRNKQLLMNQQNR